MAALRSSIIEGQEAASLAKKRASMLGGMQRQLDAWQSPQALKPETFQSRVTDAPIKQFEDVRQSMSNRANTAKQGNLEAMQRRFSAAGALNSGAAIKAQDVASQESDRALADQMSGVNLQEAQERQRRVEQDQAREESILGRNFQREMTNQSMAFQDKLSRFDAGSKLAQLDLGLEGFGLQKSESEFNKRQARYQAGRSGGLFGGGGFLGLGIGAEDAEF